MTIDSFCRHLRELLTHAATGERLETAARAMADFFGVEPHEIAFFKVDASGRNAAFRWPRTGGSAAQLSLKSFATSLVTATARERHGLIDNAFSATPHLHMYEHLLAEREQRIPVQKIMSAPASSGETLRWIIQVCRKGATLAEAGADFTPENLMHLEQIAATLAPFEL